MTNTTIARKLREHASFLEGQESSLFRVRAYRRAADVIEALERPLADVFAEEGGKGLQALPHVGPHLAYTLEELLTTGEFKTLRPVDGAVEPSQALTCLPGIGPMLAHRIEEKLGVRTLDELRQAVREGRLNDLGIGPKRQRDLIDALDRKAEQPTFPEMAANEPDVADILAIDAEYREVLRKERTQQGRHDLTWQPFFRRERSGWRFRARPCKIALAYRMGKVGDWITVSFENGITSGERIVLTETRGDLRGRRVVRGREREGIRQTGAALASGS